MAKIKRPDSRPLYPPPADTAGRQRHRCCHSQESGRASDSLCGQRGGVGRECSGLADALRWLRDGVAGGGLGDHHGAPLLAVAARVAWRCGERSAVARSEAAICMSRREMNAGSETGVDAALGSQQCVARAAAQVTCTPQARSLGEEVGRGAAMGRRQNAGPTTRIPSCRGLTKQSPVAPRGLSRGPTSRDPHRFLARYLVTGHLLF